MKTLFVLWMLIVAGFVNGKWWPTTYAGEMPVCERFELNRGAPTCAGKPALQVFFLGMSEPAAFAASQTTPDDEDSISNGF